MKGKEPARLAARKLLWFVPWALIGLVFASQLRFFSLRAGGRMTWGDAILWEVPRWCIWALIAPVVSRLGRRYPIARENAVRQIVLHTIFGAILSFIHLVFFAGFIHMFGWPGAPDASVTNLFLFAFTLDFHVGIAVYWLIVLLRQRSDSEQRVARLQSQLTRAQLAALKMQLQPHFLFNTLNSISSYLRTDIETADEMIGQLGDFLRMTLHNPGTEEIVLEQELELMRRYLGIEQLRFQERLQTTFEIDPESRKALVPNLILQPVIENAVRHGISTLASSGMILVSAKRNANRLQISVRDNGPGLPQTMKEGIGLSTTRERLLHFYGTEGRLQMENDPAGGTTVVLEMPFRLPESL